MTKKKTHPWRLCPEGEHWVITHPLKVPPSRRNPEGSITTRHAHCARNPSGKDQLYPEEIQEISNKNFSEIKNKPCSLDLGFKKRGNQYDDLIAGWVQYWNEVLSPDVPLDPNLAKALIASESGFDATKLANKKNSNSARGLMQITNGTRKILADEKGELKDHFITATKEQLNNPNTNICAGIRWLFHKMALASGKLGHSATWEEAVVEYKGLTKDLNGKNKKAKERAQELLDRFLKHFKEASECKKQ